MTEVQQVTSPVEESSKRVRESLAKYRARVDALCKQKQAKPDMVAFKELKQELTPEDTYGSIPGIKPGDYFYNRGELAIVGLHKDICRGISYRNHGDKGAFAVVMSGSYSDTEELNGMSFMYTGEGGIDSKGEQVKEQVMKNGNFHLQANCTTGTPVRVIKGSKHRGQLRYTYMGLYNVVEVLKEKMPQPSNSGPLVYKFRMEGVPGEYAAPFQEPISTSSPYLKGHRSSIRAFDQTASKRQKSEQLYSPRSKQELQNRRLALLERIRTRPGLLLVDLSYGLELATPIPVFNELEGDKNVEVPKFEYILDYQFAHGVKDQWFDVLKEERQKMMTYTNHKETRGCGLAFYRKIRAADLDWFKNVQSKKEELGYWGAAFIDKLHQDYHDITDESINIEDAGFVPFLTPEQPYTSDGLLLATDPSGIYECGFQCLESEAKMDSGISPEMCRRNMQVFNGITLPLEVFKKTEGKGWGVRCSDVIPQGAFVASYIGEIITADVAAKELAAGNNFLFGLDAFTRGVFQELHTGGYNTVEMDIPAHKIPPMPKGCVENNFRAPLSVDASLKGNVCRFINHAPCDEENGTANLTVQAVFTKDAQSVYFYYIAFFASTDIPAMAELTYDYAYHNKTSFADLMRY